MPFKLLVEKPVHEEEYEYVLEEENSKSSKTLYIKGPYMMAESVNKNKRIYSVEEMAREVQRYSNEMIANNRAMGELNHPTSAEINPERACHLVVEMKQDGNFFYGKSKVLSTPMGTIVKNLINDGVRIGVSSRALGQLEEQAGGINKVKDMRLIAIDCVADPSSPSSFVNGILESKQFILDSDGKYSEVYEGFEKTLHNLPRKDIAEYLKRQVIDFFNKLKGI